MVILVLILLLVLASCGGGSSTPTTPSNPANPYTFTLMSSGVSPKELTVPLGTRVLFVNNDSRRHDMASDPHPEHDQCPDINRRFVDAGAKSGNAESRLAQDVWLSRSRQSSADDSGGKSVDRPDNNPLTS